MNRAHAVALLVVKVGFGASLALGLGGVAHASDGRVGQLPACQFEDGNEDGLPCIWTSPRTGERYYDDSSNYR